MQSYQRYAHASSMMVARTLEGAPADSPLRDIFIGLIYMLGQINLIHANPTYVPIKEFAMLKYMMRQKLSEGEGFQFFTQTMLSLMAGYLIERDPDNAKTYAQYKFTDQTVPKEAAEILNLISQFLDPSVASSDAKSDSKAVGSATNNKQQATSNKQQTTTVTVDFQMFSDFCNKKITAKILRQKVEFLLLNHPDKKEFIQQFLAAYQQFYTHRYSRSDAATLLFEIPHLFLVLDKALAYGELEQEIAKASFMLADPRTAETDRSYNFYFLVRVLMFGTKAKKSEVDNALMMGFTSFFDAFEIILLVSKRAANFSRSIQAKDLLYLPPNLQLLFLQLEDKVKKIFLLFLEKLQKVSKQGDSFHQRDSVLLLAKFDKQIAQLVAMMSSNGIAFMQKQLAATALTLERTLENLPAIDESLLAPLHAYYQKQASLHKDINDSFYHCLIAIGILSSILEREEESAVKPSLVDFIMSMAEGKSPGEFLNALGSIIIKKLLPDSDTNLTEAQLREIFRRISPEDFIKLASASQKMQADKYKEVFLHLLRLDLLGGDVNKFLHDTAQENPQGKDLSQHNEGVRKYLREAKIATADALEYKKTFHFMITPEGSAVDVDNLQLVLWGYLLKLDEETTAALATHQDHRNQLLAIQKYIKTIRDSLGADSKPADKAKKLGTSINKTLIANILKNTKALKDKKAPLVNSFFEFADHVARQVEEIDKIPQKDKTDQKKASSAQEQFYFTVEQWPKERASTFFLGDEVGCCLATSGTQFQAMVQRRMDDALLFHVAVDRKTNKAAALAWLYLAKTQDGSVVLVANFFEVNAKYGARPEVRQGLLNGILHFTSLYLKDNPGIQGFYMNQLSYGWNVGDLANYAIKELALADKVGGPYLIADADMYEEVAPSTNGKYYLVSLQQTQFHQFDSVVLGKQWKLNVVSLQKILKTSMREMITAGDDLEKCKAKIIDRHRIELEYFYSRPLLQDKKFLSDMAQWFAESYSTKDAKLFASNQPHTFAAKLATTSAAAAASSPSELDVTATKKLGQLPNQSIK